GRPEVRAIRRGIKRPALHQVAADVADIGDIQHRTEAEVPLHAERPVVDRRRIVVALKGKDTRRTETQRLRQKLANRGVDGLSSIDQRRSFHQLQNLVVVEAVKETAETAADRGLAVAEYVVGEAEAGADLNRRGLEYSLVVQLHAVIELARARGAGAGEN